MKVKSLIPETVVTVTGIGGIIAMFVLAGVTAGLAAMPVITGLVYTFIRIRHKKAIQGPGASK